MSEVRKLSEEIIAGLLPSSLVRVKGVVSDLDSTVELGLYKCGNAPSNYPSGATPNTSDYVLYLGNSSYGIQLLVCMLTAAIFRRTKKTNGWSDWMRVSFQSIQ